MFLFLAFVVTCSATQFPLEDLIPELQNHITGFFDISSRAAMAQTSRDYRQMYSLTCLGAQDSLRYLTEADYRAEQDAAVAAPGAVLGLTLDYTSGLLYQFPLEMFVEFLAIPSAEKLGSLKILLGGDTPWNELQSALFAALATKRDFHILKLINSDWIRSGRVDLSLSRKTLAFSHIHRLTSLARLAVTGFKLDTRDSGAPWSELQQLSLEYCDIRALPAIWSMPKVRTVELIGNINLRDISALENQPRLARLTIVHMPGSHLPTLPALEHLSISSFRLGGPVEWFNPESFQRTPNLKSLEWLVPATRSTSGVPTHILSSTTERPVLSLGFLRFLPRLESLKIKYASIRRESTLEINRLADLNDVTFEKCRFL